MSGFHNFFFKQVKHAQMSALDGQILFEVYSKQPKFSIH